jgi:hypothetical protein
MVSEYPRKVAHGLLIFRFGRITGFRGKLPRYRC